MQALLLLLVEQLCIAAVPLSYSWQKQNKNPLYQPTHNSMAECSAMHRPMGMHFSERASCWMSAPLPSYDSNVWICNVFPDLRMGRMECWHFKDGSLGPQLSLRSQQYYKLEPFLDTAGAIIQNHTRPFVSLNGLPGCLCVQCIVTLKCFHWLLTLSVLHPWWDLVTPWT